MSELSDHLNEYLRLRRALGFKLEWPGKVLPDLIASIQASGATALTADLAIAWACLPQSVQPIHWAHRLGAARGFARYVKTLVPETEVPPPNVFGARQRRRAPYLWSEHEVCRLLEETRQLRPRLRAVTHEALFGLLAASGMRVGEAISLGRADVDLVDGVLTIREAKFGRSRLVPLHPSVTEQLRSYAADRDRLCPRPRSATFFVSSVGTALNRNNVHNTFVQLTTAMGLRTPTSRPRIHDLRHTFAVRTLIEWHRSGIDADSRVAVLSTYLGHINPAGTYWYLSAAPGLMELAVARLDRRFGAAP